MIMRHLIKMMRIIIRRRIRGVTTRPKIMGFCIVVQIGLTSVLYKFHIGCMRVLHRFCVGWYMFYIWFYGFCICVYKLSIGLYMCYIGFVYVVYMFHTGLYRFYTGLYTFYAGLYRFYAGLYRFYECFYRFSWAGCNPLIRFDQHSDLNTI